MTKRQIRIMIVDDEAGVRRSLIEKLKKVRLPAEIKVSAETGSGEEAYDLLKERKFDLILLDMRMPGMGGKRFLSLVREEYPEVKFIVLSGYSDFEYVQHSIRSGVIDYLLKPVIREELERALDRIVRLSEEEEARKEKADVTKSLLNQSLPLLKYQLLNRILQPSITDDVIQKLRLLGIDFRNPLYQMAVVRINGENGPSHSRADNALQENSLRFFVFENIVNDTFPEKGALVCFPHARREGEFVMIFNLPEAGAGPSGLEGQIRTLAENLARYGKLMPEITVSKPFALLSEAWITYEEINRTQAHHERSDRGMQLAESVNPVFEEAPAVHGKHFEKFIRAVEEGNFRSLSSWLAQAWTNPGEVFQHGENMGEKQIAASLYVLLKQAAERIFLGQNPIEGSMRKLFELLQGNQPGEKLRDECLKIAVEAGQFASGRNRLDAGQIIHQAKAYIEQNYFENMTLETLSGKFYLNRTYFSELFKKESGWTFKKFVNHVRIEKAKQFLAEQDLRPSVVAELVGIQDPVYFTVLFKKMTGFSPGEYRLAHRCREANRVSGSGNGPHYRK